MEHIVKSFDQELGDLKDAVLKMGVLVQELIIKSVDALKNRDLYLAKEVIKKDEEVDHLELEINEKCINMIALRQPKAGDLRFIMMATRVATDLERIGDLAEDIAERAIEISGQELIKPLVDIPKMAKLAQDSVALALDAFIHSDPKRAAKVWQIEKEVDHLRDSIQNELQELMINDSKLVSRALPLLLVARHLERICDHTTNIVEDVTYMADARVIKHHAKE